MEELNVYEEQVNETEELIPVEATVEEEAGMSNGVAFALGSLATAGAIWLGNKVVKFVKKVAINTVHKVDCFKSKFRLPKSNLWSVAAS